MVKKLRLFGAKHFSPPVVPLKKKDQVPRYMSDTRREKLERLIKKTEVESKKNKLKYILVQKLALKYPGAKNKPLLETFVTELLDKNSDITEHDLVHLDKEIQQMLEMHKKNGGMKITRSQHELRAAQELAAQQVMLITYINLPYLYNCDFNNIFFNLSLGTTKASIRA